MRSPDRRYHNMGCEAGIADSTSCGHSAIDSARVKSPARKRVQERGAGLAEGLARARWRGAPSGGYGDRAYGDSLLDFSWAQARTDRVIKRSRKLSP
jgi:hypothetical protein